MVQGGSQTTPQTSDAFISKNISNPILRRKNQCQLYEIF